MRSQPSLSSRTVNGQWPENGKYFALSPTRSPNLISLAGFVGKTISPTQGLSGSAAAAVMAKNPAVMTMANRRTNIRLMTSSWHSTVSNHSHEAARLRNPEQHLEEFPAQFDLDTQDAG